MLTSLYQYQQRNLQVPPRKLPKPTQYAIVEIDCSGFKNILIQSEDDCVAYELTGKIKLIQEPKTFDSGFTKREMVVIVEDGKYPQEINLEFVQDKVALLDKLQAGQEVKVTFDIRGREYNGRYFNNLQGWKIETIGDEAAYSAADPSPAPPYPTPDDFGDDDIPF